MLRHLVTMRTKFTQVQNMQLGQSAYDLAQIVFQSIHMCHVPLSCLIQLSGLHTHIVKCSMQKHWFRKMRHPRVAKPRTLQHTVAKPRTLQPSDVRRQALACDSKHWLAFWSQKKYTLNFCSRNIHLFAKICFMFTALIFRIRPASSDPNAN